MTNIPYQVKWHRAPSWKSGSARLIGDDAPLFIDELPNGVFELCEYADSGKIISRQEFLTLADAFDVADAIEQTKRVPQRRKSKR
jgi:hypothetical protein